MNFEERYLMIEETPYNRLAVVDIGGYRILKFGIAEQSSMSLANPIESGFEYTDYFHLPALFGIPFHRALFIGLGGGMGVKMYRHFHPDVFIDAVEIDPAVVKAAKTYFHLEEDDHFRVHLGDGKEFLGRTREYYDVVILDAYTVIDGKSGPPEHLMQSDFFGDIRNHLTDRGMLIFNLTGTTWGEPTKTLRRILREHFKAAYLFSVRSSLNVVLAASMGPPLTRQDLRQQGLSLQEAKGPTRMTYLD
ncbi:MAG: spermidine synthase, partial [bacterium]